MIVKKGDDVSALVDDIKLRRERNHDHTITETDPGFDIVIPEPVVTIVRTGARAALFSFLGL